ncbi:uncharacterized protein LOC122247553 [Penaeus japonicus]|uniref:uncharacterized protein LOC122247553 n=1 Tax=Penaeus japonicus TaxID=27405 RepID=UPI001C70BB86|nr:uncharacterized protein LOC122247553 [Penaeus japonicus]
MSLKLEIDGVLLNVVSACAPQVGGDREEIEEFWEKLDEADMAVINTFYSKRESHKVTYTSGFGRDCKVIPGESVAKQHHVTTGKMKPTSRRKREVKAEPRIKWKKKEDKETWWWNEEVQEAIERKKEAWKEWHKRKGLRSKFLYKEAKNKAKVAVATAKEEANEKMYEKLDMKEGENMVCKVAKQRDRAAKDVQQIRLIKDTEDNVDHQGGGAAEMERLVRRADEC